MARRARGNGIPWASLFGVFLILAVISVFSYVLWYKSTQTDHVNKDGCPTDTSLIPSTWIALIDATTKFDDSQILALNNLGEKLIKLAPKYAEIKIYMMTGESISKKNLVASVCNPGDPNNINPWTQSQRQVRNNFNINYKWVEGFQYEGSPQFTGTVPTYNLLDIQISKKIPKYHITLSLIHI